MHSSLYFVFKKCLLSTYSSRKNKAKNLNASQAKSLSKSIISKEQIWEAVIFVRWAFDQLSEREITSIQTCINSMVCTDIFQRTSVRNAAFFPFFVSFRLATAKQEIRADKSLRSGEWAVWMRKALARENPTAQKKLWFSVWLLFGLENYFQHGCLVYMVLGCTKTGAPLSCVSKICQCFLWHSAWYGEFYSEGPHHKLVFLCLFLPPWNKNVWKSFRKILYFLSVSEQNFRTAMRIVFFH